MATMPRDVRRGGDERGRNGLFGITTRASGSADQPPDLGDNLGDGADVGQRVQRHGDVEVIFQLADEFQHLQRVETESASSSLWGLGSIGRRLRRLRISMVSRSNRS